MSQRRETRKETQAHTDIHTYIHDLATYLPDFGKAVDTKVGVHQFDDGAVAVHGLAQGFTDEVTL